MSIRAAAGPATRCRTTRYIALCIVGSWLPSSRASADLLIETYRDARPGDADRVPTPPRDELARGGIEVRPSAIGNASELFPLPGTTDPAIDPAYPADPGAQVEL